MRISPLQVGYVVDALVTAPIAFSMLSGSGKWIPRLLGEPVPPSPSLRMMLGSLWMALLLCVIVGIFRPVSMIPVLVLQLVYKGLWLAAFAAPRWMSGRSHEVSWQISRLFMAYVLIYPWLIPWSRLLSQAD